MRRSWVVALAVLTLLGVLSPPAFAQAPAPTVTINGAVEFATAAAHNTLDGNFTRSNDREWYSRLRFRPDITGQVGRVKAVLGIEIDELMGQQNVTESIVTTNAGTSPGHSGVECSFDLNTDTTGCIQIKWAYIEFPLTGEGSLLPFVPTTSVARVGGQPFATTYKLATLATGDFGGVNVDTVWTPTVKSHLTYAQIEERGGMYQGAFFIPSATGITVGSSTTGSQLRCQNDIASRQTGPATATTGVTVATGSQGCRGDDWALIASVEWTPIKGLDLRPTYAYFNSFGTTNANSTSQVAAQVANSNLVAEERRHTLGVDARWTWGPLFVDPTVFWQFGSREARCATPGSFAGEAPRSCFVGTRHLQDTANISAWLADIRSGYRWGPLLLEAMVAYVSGNNARDNLAKRISYYQPIDTDTSYFATWANILALGIDSVGTSQTVNNLGGNMSYFQYGRIQTGFRGTYSWTPALDTYLYVDPTWTAKSVDTDSVANTRAKACIGNGASGISCDYKGDSSYLGTEGGVGLVWRFAPNTRFDLVGSWLFAGGALNAAETITPAGSAPVCGATICDAQKKDSSDAWVIASKVTFNF